MVPHAPARLTFLLTQRPHYRRCAFGPHGQALASERRELEHLLLDDIAAVTKGALEQRSLLEDGSFYRHAIIRCDNARRSMNHGVSGCDVSIEEVACASHSSEARRRGGGDRSGGGKMAGKRETKRDGHEL